MSDPFTYEVLAKAVVAEGVQAHFTLMGTPIMHWVDTMVRRHGVKTIHVRHEHTAVTMADGYHRATGRVGLASVTCGPGFTQTSTALAVAARARSAIVVVVGDTPTNVGFHQQEFAIGPLATATGAAFVEARHVDMVLDKLREAFWTAKVDQRPVVLSIPSDYQKQRYPHLYDYWPSDAMMPTAQRPAPDPELVEQAAQMLAQSERPIVLAGRGAVRSGAGNILEELAEHCGALLGTSLFAKGLFDANPFSLGVAGAFAGDTAREMYAECDVLLGVGAGLGHYTTEAGYLYPNAKVIHIDLNPRGFWQGQRTADLSIKADAKLAAELILRRVRDLKNPSAGVRHPKLADQLAAEIRQPDKKEFAKTPGTLDPRQAALEIDGAVPKDWDVVVGSGHFFSIVLSHMHARPPERIHVVNEFGAIGSGLAVALGVAAARGDGKVLLLEGDGAMMMHVQELETAARHKLKLAMCVFNDGEFAAEAHKFRAESRDPGEAIHGRANFAGVAKAFELRGETITSPGRFEGLVKDYQANRSAELWNVHIDQNVQSRMFRRVWLGER